MDNIPKEEVMISAILIFLIGVFLNPFGLWMPDRLVYMLIVGFIVVFVLFVSLIYKEKVRDEREQLHKLLSGRVAYVAGTSALVLGIVIEGITQPHIDPWLLVTLGVMVLAKMGGLLYSRHKY